MRISDWSSDVCSSDLGASEVTCEPEDPGSFAAMLVSPLLVLSGVSRSLTFWILFGTFFICGATTSGLVQTHLIAICGDFGITRSEEHTSELQSLMRNSYAIFCLKKQNKPPTGTHILL